MMLALLVGLPLVAGILYANTVSILIKIKKGEETFENTAWGAVLFGALVLGFIFLVFVSR
ncbi:hypothetical protein J2Z22_003338 [Paenibacillus forsythiae]|uniref:Uncharacterized protein n=1 Tax=Paenibacillus forsythiae TaxID=365616 RepID=A0ABU3HAB6_9BACL|nr:hypothetical protein [Paenibacillus forsythiae]MDT3427762.1 hypothetical protein [Paenibacillus forsythiae]